MDPQEENIEVVNMHRKWHSESRAKKLCTYFYTELITYS